MDKLTKLAQELNLSHDDIKEIITQHHSINNLLPKKQIKTVNLEISTKEEQEAIKLVKKIAKKLKVDKDAVIAHLITKYIKG